MKEKHKAGMGLGELGKLFVGLIVLERWVPCLDDLECMYGIPMKRDTLRDHFKGNERKWVEGTVRDGSRTIAPGLTYIVGSGHAR